MRLFPALASGSGLLDPASAFRRQALIDPGTYSYTSELAEATGKVPAYISGILRLPLLAPEIIHAILAGTWQRSVPLEKLRKQRDADPLGGPEEALLDGGKAGSSMMIDGEGKIHIMFFLMADCGLLFAS